MDRRKGIYRNSHHHIIMPELAEVESSRKFVNEIFAGYIVESICTLEQGGGPRDGLFDDVVYDSEDPVEHECK